MTFAYLKKLIIFSHCFNYSHSKASSFAVYLLICKFGVYYLRFLPDYQYKFYLKKETTDENQDEIGDWNKFTVYGIFNSGKFQLVLYLKIIKTGSTYYEG